MLLSKNSITTPSGMTAVFILDIVIVGSIILFITGIAPIFFISLLGFVLTGAVISTAWECYHFFIKQKERKL